MPPGADKQGSGTEGVSPSVSYPRRLRLIDRRDDHCRGCPTARYARVISIMRGFQGIAPESDTATVRLRAVFGGKNLKWDEGQDERYEYARITYCLLLE
jgi:hypothetical protein